MIEFKRLSSFRRNHERMMFLEAISVPTANCTIFSLHVLTQVFWIFYSFTFNFVFEFFKLFINCRTSLLVIEHLHWDILIIMSAQKLSHTRRWFFIYVRHSRSNQIIALNPKVNGISRYSCAYVNVSEGKNFRNYLIKPTFLKTLLTFSILCRSLHSDFICKDSGSKVEKIFFWAVNSLMRRILG